MEYSKDDLREDQQRQRDGVRGWSATTYRAAQRGGRYALRVFGMGDRESWEEKAVTTKSEEEEEDGMGGGDEMENPGADDLLPTDPNYNFPDLTGDDESPGAGRGDDPAPPTGTYYGAGPFFGSRTGTGEGDRPTEPNEHDDL